MECSLSLFGVCFDQDQEWVSCIVEIASENKIKRDGTVMVMFVMTRLLEACFVSRSSSVLPVSFLCTGAGIPRCSNNVRLSLVARTTAPPSGRYTI